MDRLKWMLDFSQDRGVDADDILSATGLLVDRAFDGIGDTSSTHRSRLVSFLSDVQFLQSVIENPNIDAVFCREADVDKIFGKAVIPCADPKHAFFSVITARAKSLFSDVDSILETRPEHPSVSIAAKGVFIGPNVLIEPYVTIHPGVAIAQGAIIRAGAVLGVDSFQHQRSAAGLYSVGHDGVLLIEQDVEIGANCTISKGFSYRPTIIGANTKIDALSYVGHGTRIGKEAIICAGTKILGHAVVGDRVFLGPGTLLSSRLQVGTGARTSIGSVITRDVAPGAHVTGNFAVPHEKWIAFMRAIR